MPTYVCLASSADRNRDKKKIGNFNQSRPQAERISMDDLRGQTVTPNLKRFLKYIGCEIDVGQPIPAMMKLTQAAASTWVDLRTSNRHGENLAALAPAPDPDSDNKFLFCWTHAHDPQAMYFSGKAYKNLTNKGKRLLWLTRKGLAIGDAVHADVRFTPISTTRREAVAQKQNEAALLADGEERGPIGISWLQFLTSVTPVNKLGNTELVELPPTATIEDWRASGLKVLVHDGVKQVALQIYDRREYLISFLQESVQEEPNALRLTRFKGNLEQELEMLKLAEEKQHWMLFAKRYARTPEIKIAADGKLATIACFDEEAVLQHSGEGTFTANLGIPLIGRHALLEQASADKKLGFYLRPVVGTSISQEGLYGRRIFGDEDEDAPCHVYSQLLPAYRISGDPDEDDEENDLGLSWLQQIEPTEAWAPWRIEQGVVPASDFSAIATTLQVIALCADLPQLPVKIENNSDLQEWLKFDFDLLQEEVLEMVRAVLAKP